MPVQVTILAPQVWQPAVDVAAADLSDPAASLMRAAIRYLHDRHVGIAPRPAARLALTLLRDGRSTSRTLRARRELAADWTGVVERLAASVLPEVSGGEGRGAGGQRRERSPATVQPSSIPFAILDRIVLPLVAAAQRRTGRCCLFGAAGHAVPSAGARYLDDYDSEQDAAIGAVCAAISVDPPRLFWAHRGVDMAALSRGSAGNGGSFPLPDADPETVALLMRLEPVLGTMVRRPVQSRRPQRAALQASGVRPREGGVAGIRTTRSIDDIDDMLVSEFTNHPLILLDRLVNSGFMVRHRPPRRQNRRDVLLVGAMPGGSRGAAGRLAKVSWIDAMARLAPLLQDAGLFNSDFAWLDGDRLGGLSSGFSGLPQGLPLPGDGVNLSAADRMRFVWALDWLPELLDRRRTYPSSVEASGVDPQDGTHRSATELSSAAGRWVAGALAHTMERAHSTAGGESRALEVNDYGVVHVIVMLPRPAAGLEDGEVRSAVFAAVNSLRLEVGRRQTASVLWLPGRIGDIDHWTMAFGEGPSRRVADFLAPPPAATPETADAADPHRIAGGLIGLWLTHLQEAILGG